MLCKDCDNKKRCTVYKLQPLVAQLLVVCPNYYVNGKYKGGNIE